MGERLRSADVRLLSLVGAAGTGKTRLAIEVANQVAEHFADGTWFVDLANFEQVLPAAPYLADLLRACAELKLLVTSRSALHLHWEHQLVVHPLAVPDLAALPTPATLAEVASVALLMQRTQRIDPDFRLDDDNAREIAEICVRLDGLPLAIELAAARMRVLPPRSLLSRLSRGLAVLDSGDQDQPPRQRTLRAASNWSYELLSPAEQALFRRLSVFVGGFGLEP